MSRTPPRYLVRIECADVPESLRETPILVEVVSEAGVSERMTLDLLESVWDVSVDGPGAYLVRTQLPSGHWISATTTVPEPPEKAGGEAAIGAARLSFGSRKPRAEVVIAGAEVVPASAEGTTVGDTDFPGANFSGAAGGGRVRMGVKSVPSRFHFGTPGPPQSAPASGPPGGPVSAVSDRAELRGGFFDGWQEDRDPDTKGMRLSIRLRGEEVSAAPEIDLPGDFVLPDHPGRPGNPQGWRPLFVRARLRFADAGERSTDALIVWPPTGYPARLTLLPDPDISENPATVPLIALAETGDRAVDALFSYVRGNALETARQVAPDVIARAEGFLHSKVSNPLYATLAAYALFKLGSDARPDWVRNLADWFGFLPDGAVLQGWFRIHAGRAEEAGGWFHTALERGVPMYTEGVRLLHDGLNFLRGLYPDDAGIQSDADRAYRLASVANFDSELTCLSLNAALGVRFAEDSG